MNRITLVIGACVAAVVASAPAHAQLFRMTPQQIIELTSKNPFERFPDGRPKIPDALIERARGVSPEEVFGVLGASGGRGGFRNQYADGFLATHPGKKLIGRAFTVQFMPQRQDLEDVVQAHSQAGGTGRMYNQTVIDMLQPGDVLVVDLFGKGEDGTIVGDNLFYYIMKVAKAGGIVVDGSVRDLDEISGMDMPLYYRHGHPSYLTNVTLTGVNVPIRIGSATVMPGDLVLGDAEGLYFVPPQMVQQVVDSADKIHIHDEWTRKKFDEGKYKSQDIYSTPKDPALKKEYDDYLAKRLAEINKK